MRKGLEHEASLRSPTDRTRRLAHPSESFPIRLNANWRVVDDPLQWILQRRKGYARSRNAGWRGRSYFTTRTWLLHFIGEYCGEVDPDALKQLEALPERHR